MAALASLGVRTIGSAANEEEAPAYLLAALERVRTAASPDVLVEFGTQHPSGAYTTSFLGGIAISYRFARHRCRRCCRRPRPCCRPMPCSRRR
jgi:hypothetical protein